MNTFTNTLGGSSCVLITKGRKVLAVTRKDNHEDWGLPGGKVEPEETFAEAAVRELREETGLVVEARHLIPVYGQIMPSEKFSLTFRALLWSGELMTSEEGLVSYVPFESLCRGSYGDYNDRVLQVCFGLNWRTT